MNDPRLPDKVDPKILGVIIFGLLLAILVFVGDQVAFVRPSKNFIEEAFGFLPALFFLLLKDRLLADGMAGGIYLAIMLFAGIFLYKLIVHKVVEPGMIKKMIRAKQREKELLNKFNDDTI